MRASILLVAAALTLPAAALAAQAPSESGRAAFARFKALDTDGDRVLGRAELARLGRERSADALFALLDADGDRRLSVKEVEAAGGPGLARFQAYDANRDGVVTRQEFPSFADPLLLAALDGDGDGGLELRDLRPEFAGWRPAAPDQAPEAARPARDEPPPPCWVPNFGGGDDWMIEVPVVVSPAGCRTVP